MIGALACQRLQGRCYHAAMKSSHPEGETAFVVADARRDPFYYLVNLESVLRWVQKRYGDLLSAAERAFIDTFFALSRAPRALLVRMIMRKGEHFCTRGLAYDEIGEPSDAIKALSRAELVDTAPALSVTELGTLFKRDELAALIDDSDALRLRKADLIERLSERFEAAATPAEWQARTGRPLPDEVVALTVTPICERLRLMFFGNLRQQFSEFVLADLGLYRFETVPFTEDSRAFQSRADIECYWRLHRLRERFDQGEAVESIIADLPGPLIQSRWLESRRGRLLFTLARHLERGGALEAAEALYAESVHGEARTRQARCLEGLSCFERALSLAEKACAAPRSEAEQQQMARLAVRLRRRLGRAALKAIKAPAPDRLDLTLPRASSVERAVRDHLATPEAPVVYVENTLINALFGLLCWEAIFAPLPGAFFHPFQSGPADLARPTFYAQREALFKHALARLENDTWRSRVREQFHRRYGLQNPFVHWGALTPELLELAMTCLPPRHLRLWFERLLRDVRANRAGMPDLIRFHPHEQNASRYEMIEVKGPGDRLQDNQKRWLDFCLTHGMPVTVCHVRWADTRTENDPGEAAP